MPLLYFHVKCQIERKTEVLIANIDYLLYKFPFYIFR